MEYQYEAIKHQIDIPVKIFTQTVEQFPFHWHEDMEILLILEGAIEIRVEQNTHNLNEGDLFLVNNNEIHFIKSNAAYGKTKLLALQFNGDYFRKYQMDFSNRRFRLNSSIADKRYNSLYDEIRFILAEMMNLVLNQEAFYNLNVEKLLIELGVILLRQFEIEGDLMKKDSIHDERLLDILKYINEHCTESKIGIQEISEIFFLNPQYLSRYFKAQVGISLKKFLDNMRMTKSLNALRASDERILDIALKFGFPDAKAYYRVFKSVLGMTPMEYRERHKLEVEKHQVKDYFSINSSEALSKLFEYLDIPKQNNALINVDRQVKVKLNKYSEPLEHTFTNLMTFGYAPHGLRKDFTKQLKTIQDEIGFKYIRFHGIFSDELLVCNKRPDGSIYYNFNHVDALLDNLLAHNVKPFLELGFMPKALASKEHTIFWWTANISPPKDMKEWVLLVEAFVKHLVNRYGIAEVRTWYFEFWNEPDIENFFWYGTKEEFFEMYKVSYQVIKSIDSELKIGGFGNVLFSDVQTWLDEFDVYATANNIKLDFFSFHVYNLKVESQLSLKNLASLRSVNKNLMEHAKSYGIVLGDESFITDTIDLMIENNKSLESSSEECWITEWNANTDSRDLVHDTCYMAAFIVKNVLSNFDKVNGMGFWTFSDIFEEFQLEQPLFHGGFGLMTFNGLKKPGYNAFYLLGKLGTELVYQNENLIVTKSEEEFQVMVFNYCHPNNLYSSLDYSQLSMTNRYGVFDSETAISYKINLEDINGNYHIERYSINRKQGSSYDAWVEIGAPTIITDDAVKYLKGKAEPAYFSEEVLIENSHIIDTVLTPHEVQLFILKKTY